MLRNLIPILLLAAFPVLKAADAPSVTASTTVPAAVRDPRYKLNPTDRLELKYRYTPEFDQSITVEPDGFATVSLIGDVKLAGLTLDQARAVLLERLNKRLNNPEITLTLEQYVMPSFVVAGQVANPGRYELHGPVSVVEGLALAGGLKDSAKHSEVILYRRISPDVAETHILNIKKITNPKHPHLEEAMALEPGDLLVVPQNASSKIDHYVHWVSFGGYIPF